jgi:hypothetical protein
VKKLLFVLLMIILTGVGATAQSESKRGVCVWVDSENPGSMMVGQAGGSVLPITKPAVSRIQLMATNGLRSDTTNLVLDTCPQTGENFEIDVVVGRFHGGYVASVSTTMQGSKEGPILVSSNVIAAGTEKILAADVSLAYESLKLSVQMGLKGK